jgi:hypothetical protein
MALPVVCDPLVFSKDQQLAHLELARDVLLRWPRSRTDLPDAYQFIYEGEEERFLTIARWAAAEHRCCAWASYAVEIRAPRRRLGSWAETGLVACLTAALGCVGLGLGGAQAVFAAVLAGAIAAWVPARANG